MFRECTNHFMNFKDVMVVQLCCLSSETFIDCLDKFVTIHSLEIKALE